jgi:hypothetical protein
VKLSTLLRSVEIKLVREGGLEPPRLPARS